MIGYRHKPECNCGCQHVVGIRGVIRRDEDTPKLKSLGLLYADFQTPYGERTICYDWFDHHIDPVPWRFPG